MSTTSTSTSTLTTVSVANLIGIFVSVVLVIMYLIFSGHAIKYIKTFALKIKLIANRVEDKNIQLKDYNYQPVREQVRNTPGYKQMEAIFKNEVRKSRSLQFKNIIGSYMAKYNHLIHFPFRDRIADKVDLLKPKSTFFNLIVVTQLCVVWMITIFLSAILQYVYTDISTVAVGLFIGLTVVISIVASLINVIQINRLQHLYVLNIKNAFKSQNEQCKFVQLQGDHNNIKEYSPENSMDEIEFEQHLENLRLSKSGNKNSQYSQYSQSTLGAGLMTSRTTTRDDNITMHSSRKLILSDDGDKNNTLKKNFNVPNKSIIMEDNEGEDYEYEDAHYSQHSAIKLKSPLGNKSGNEYLAYEINEKSIRLKPVINKLNMNNMGGAESIYDKYAFIEDTHAIGEQHLLQNEAFKGENKSNIITFGTIFVIIAVACIVCCYLNYTFSALLSRDIFFMFIGAFFLDMLVFRMLLVLLMAAIKYMRAKKQGYQKVPYQQPQEIKKLFDSSIKNTTTKTSSDKNILLNSTNDLRFKNKQNSIDGLEYENQTQGHYERNDTSMKQDIGEEQKEDEYAQEIDENGFKKTDHYGPGKIPHQESYISNNPLLKVNELSESPFKSTQGQLQLTQFSLLKTLHNNSDKPQLQYEQLMDKKQIVNQLADYNLMLFRMIYDAYDERGERVIRKFRTDDHSVIRKRFMQPVLNPNFDHEEWLKDQLKNKTTEEIGGEFEEQLHPEQELSGKDTNKIEPVVQEMIDDPKSNKVERLTIDKFGNLISDKPSEVMIVLPQPAYGIINMEKEINEGSEDEWSKKLKELQMLRAKKQKGEKLTEKENTRLTELETEEDIYRHDDIEHLQSLNNKITDEQSVDLNNLLKEETEYRNRRINDLQIKEKNHSINDQEKKELKMLLDWQKEQKKKLLEELRLKKANNQLTEEESRMLKMLEDEEWKAKKSELEILREKMKNGTITEEEKRRLQQLEEEEKRRNYSELEELIQKLKNGTISEEELKRLHELQEWEKNLKNKQLEELRQKLKNGTLTDEEKKLLQQLEDEEHKSKLSELEMLRQKMMKGQLSEEEIKRLEELEEWEHQNRMKEIEFLQNKKNKTAEDIARLKQLLSDEDLRVENQLQSLYNKLARGEHLSDEEKRKLMELEAYKHKRLVDQIEELKSLGDNISDQDKLRLLFLQRELLKLELQQLKRKDDPLSEEDQARMKTLEENIDKYEYDYLVLKKQISTLTNVEEDRLRELEARLKMNDLSQIEKDENEESVLFEDENMLNGQQNMQQEDEESMMKTEEAESRITDNDNFADLPPVEVIGNIKKPKSSESQRQRGEALNQKNTEEKNNLLQQNEKTEQHDKNYNFQDDKVISNEQVNHQSSHKDERVTSAKSDHRVRFAQNKEDINSERFGLDENEKLLKEGDKGYDEQQQKIQSARSQYSNDTRRGSCSKYGLNDNEELLHKGQDGYEEQQERIQTAKTGLRKGENILNEGDQGFDEQQERMKTAQSRYRDHLKLEEDRLGLRDDEEMLHPGQQGYEEQQQRIKKAKNGGLQDGEKLLEKGEKGYEQQQERIQQSQQDQHIEPSVEQKYNKQEENKHKQHHEQLSQQEENNQSNKTKKELNQNENAANNESIDHQRIAGLKEGEKLLKKGDKGYEEQQNRINSAKQHQMTDEQRLSSSRQSNRQSLSRLQSAKSRQSNSRLERLSSAQSNQMDSSRTGLREGETKLNPGDKGFEQQQERIKSAISQRKEEMHSAIHGLRDGERLLNPGEPGYEEQQHRLQQTQRSGKKSIMTEQDRIKSAISGNRNNQARLDSEADSDMQMRPVTSSSGMRNSHQEMANSLRSMSSRQQDRNNKHPHSGLENYDRGLSNDDMLEFGHDDLEMAGVPARAESALPPDESIYSHKTSTILDEEKVSFMHIEHLPDQDQASDDSFAEQDMVYYNKDDLTNYSKGLGLNKVKAKPQNQPTYYSENDIQEVHEGSISDEGGMDESRSLDASRKRQNARGLIKHNDLEVQSYNDQIDGRLKVDSWNLNYNGKKKKHRKRKIDQSVQRRMDALQNIYGVDAKTLAGVNRARAAPLISGGNKTKDGNLGSSRVSDNMSFRSTQNTFFKTGAKGINSKGSALDINSNMFSSNGFTGKGPGGFGMSKRWNDIESTLKGNKAGGGSQNRSLQQNLNSQYSPNNKQGNQSGKPFANQNKKLTSTQQKFNMQEESKSRSNSRGGNSNNKMQSSSLKKNVANKSKKAVPKRNSQGYDDYSESDEGVNDQGALFQKRDAPHAWNKEQKPSAGKKNKKQTYIDNEIDHDESDEGVYEHDPNFEGNTSQNDPLFQRRAFDLSHQNDQSRHKTMNVRSNNESNKSGMHPMMARNMSEGSDLERQGGLGRGGSNAKFGANNYGGRNSDISAGSKSISPTKPPLGNAQRKTGNGQNEKLRINRGSLDSNENRLRSVGSGGGIKPKKSASRNDQPRGRRTNGFSGADNNDDDNDQFIVGPESNHSMIQSRKDFNKQHKRNSMDDENVGYLSIHKDRQVSNYDSSKSPDKKRKVRRAAHSTGDADQELNKLYTMKNERLKKSQMQAENALFDRTGEESLTKKKKKKQQKDSVKKEVNYWLDYDSPYAEYLVARFREWSPNVKPVQSRGGDSSERQHGKYKEIQNVYAHKDDSRQMTVKKSSVSPNRNGTMNLTSNSIGNESVQVLANKKRTQKNKNSQDSRNINKHVSAATQGASQNQLYFHEVEDYEEP